MKKKVFLFVFLMLLIAGISNGARYNYTWEDKDGVLNVTDFPPPEGANIIDISVIPMPKKKLLAIEEKQQKDLQLQSETRELLLVEAAALRSEEVALRLKAAELNAEAWEQRRLSKLHRYKDRYRRRASKKEQQAQDLISQADSLGRKAEILERKSSKLN